MNKTIISGALALLAFQWAAAISIVSGPYLQNVTETSCDILWRTDHPSTAWVELAPDDSTHFYQEERPRTYATDLGRAVVGTFHRVTLKGLTPGTSYRYRIFSEEVLRQDPYHVDYGGIAAAKVHRAKLPVFTTLSQAKPDLDFLVINDIHGRTDALTDLLSGVRPGETDFVFYNGDMVSFMDNEEGLFGGFIDTSVGQFASCIPFMMSRGNHETRGALAKDYMRYFPTPTGKPYYSFRSGPCYFIVLDAGEDKPDSDIEYSRTSFFDDYRRDEAEWLRETVESEECRQAPFRIVIMHVPLAEAKWHGPVHARSLFLPILNEAGIDLMLCGHRHSYHYHPKGTDGAAFPVLVNSNNEAVRVKAGADGIDLEVTDRSGSTLRRFHYDPTRRR